MSKTRIRIVPAGGPLGADAWGVDLEDLSGEEFAFVPQLPPTESGALLDELWAHATGEVFTWYQRWRLGDVVVRDNRCTMHRRDALDPNERRLLNRAQVRGTRPVAAAA